MKQPRWSIWIVEAILCLSLSQAVLNCQVDEYPVTPTLLLGNVLIAGDDQPAEQANVEIKNATGAPVASTVASWGGEFHFVGLAPGEYFLSANKSGFETISEKVQFPLADKRITIRLKRHSDAGQAAISVRELSIPPKAQIALRNAIRLLKEDLPRGMANVQQAIALYPNYYEAYHVLGIANLMVGDLPAAAEAFHQSIKLSDHHYARPLIALGGVFCDMERFAEAESTVREGLELDATPWVGHLLLARALFGLNRWNEAEQSVNEAIQREPEVPEAYLLLAHIHAGRQNETAALRDLQEFLKLQPNGSTSDQVRAVQSVVALHLDAR